VSAAGQDAVERGATAGSKPEPGNVATYDGAYRKHGSSDCWCSETGHATYSSN